ncbi:MAG: VOC family protein [Gammaproteobacteria bacterium]|nr:VOC family protein [Gammaproteobacteria bacterium]MBT8110385.1 VOC family protein [Gammaproteobacteria bacterium]NNC57619.1 VOC family protein [Woeseiaceae bacterium]NNL45087.1 VOC family protein [Woeseiaceae bacterium]
MYIPDGYGTVFPYMIVNDANEFIDFLSKVFDAEEVGRTEFPGGRVANARIRIGTSTFMVGEADNENILPMPGSYYVYVEDVDQTLEKAIGNGAVKLFDAADMSYDDRQAGITDPAGNAWWISRRLVDASYDP